MSAASPSSTMAPFCSTYARSATSRARFALCSTIKMVTPSALRSEEHTSELQSRGHLVCRLLLEKKKNDTAKNANRDRKQISLEEGREGGMKRVHVAGERQGGRQRRANREAELVESESQRGARAN